MKILLIGNPNVGKSAIFSRLTGIDVKVSNYAGTTVEFKKGCMPYQGKTVEVIDVPGTYSLKPTNKAEKVAVEMLKEGDLVINIVDATNLERNLSLSFELMEKNVPMVIALNIWDEAKHTGINIDVKKLEGLLGVSVIPTIALTGEGIKRLMKNLQKVKILKTKKYSDKERWSRIGRIIKQVQRIEPRCHTFLERLSDASINPIAGIPIAIMIMLLSFTIIRFIGENLISYVFDPLFELYRPLVIWVGGLFGQGFINDILIGNLINGQIDFTQSMGLLTTGFYVPIAMVLPYVFSFYIILGFLEDFGYLPRLAVLIDNVMHNLGMHGFSIIPMILGLGCNVPGALSTRILCSKKEKFISATLMAISVPCMAQTAMVISLVGPYGISGIGTVFLTLFSVWIIVGLILNKTIGGKSPELFMEISPYRIPYFKALLKKLWMRIRSFVTHAIPYMLFGVLIINILDTLGIISFIGNIAAPVVVNIFGLPKEAIAALIAGFLRKDVAIGMLLPLSLSFKQLIIASVILTMYFPCVATFVILVKELGTRAMIRSALIMVFATLIVGGLLNLVIWF